MIKICILVALLAVAAFLVPGCTQTPSTATAIPVVTGTPVSQPGWEAEWEKVVREARKEGTVYVYGPPLPEVREALTVAFPRAYPGIRLDYTALPTGELIARVKAAYGAGIHDVDVIIGGTTTVLTGVRPVVQPIRPFLILPEVTDPKAWLGGKLEFADNAGEINLVFVQLTHSGVIYNVDQVDPKELISWWDLVKPKWKGKVTMVDPRMPGPGNAFVTFWHENPQLGPSYVKAVMDFGPVFTRDVRIHGESVGRGKYSIGIAPHVISAELIKSGLPMKYARVMKEGSYSTAASGSVAVMKEAPNTNAAKVFLNWLLGKEGQKVFAVAGSYFSRRVDVSSDHLFEGFVPEPGVAYWPSWSEDIVVSKQAAIDAFIREALSK